MRKKQAQDQLVQAASGPNTEVKMSNNLMRAAKAAVEDDDGFTMAEREEQAELRFKAIAKRVAQR